MRPCCGVIGSKELFEAVLEAAPKGASVFNLPNSAGTTDFNSLPRKADCLFVDGQHIKGNFEQLVATAKANNPDVRLIVFLLDSSARACFLALGAHSVVELNKEHLTIAARYWGTCLYPP